MTETVTPTIDQEVKERETADPGHQHALCFVCNNLVEWYTGWCWGIIGYVPDIKVISMCGVTLTLRQWMATVPINCAMCEVLWEQHIQCEENYYRG